MRTILKMRWLVFAVWIAAVVGLVMTAPNMEELVREKGQISVPPGYTSTNAQELLKQMNGDKAGSKELFAALVFHNPNGLTDADKAEVKRTVEKLKNDKATLGITTVTSHYDTPELEKQLVAKDGKTIIAAVSVELKGRTQGETRDALYAAVQDVKVEHYYTGSWLIDEDVIVSSQEGLKKTEWITIVFILSILFLVFRSVIAAFIPLLTVGISYMAAQSVVAFLVKSFDFPLSNFTQIFMVAVMFGIGTDYCILLISRFKEELAHHQGDVKSAILTTYKTAGRTVFFSGLAVLVGFASIGLSTFVLYRSAVAVAVGVAVLLLALLTIVPFFMAVLGKVIFWPSKGSLEHKPSGIWNAAGRFSLKRPLLALAFVAVVVVPFLIAYKGSLSFNSLDEIGNKYNSVKAFQIISSSFGPGDSLPSKLVLKSDKPLDNGADLATLEAVSREIAKVDGVKTVRAVTRPTGEPIADFAVTKQTDQLGTGIGQAGDGLNEIRKGLADASSALNGNAPKLKEAVNGAGQLVDGTNALKAGVVQLGDGLKQLQKGLQDGSAGAKELNQGLRQAKENADQLAAASSELVKSYEQMGAGLQQLSGGYDQLAGQLTGLSQGISGVKQGLNGLGQKYPELQNDPDYQKTLGDATELEKGAAQLDTGLKELNAQLAGVSAGMAQANAGFTQAAGGQAALAQGLGSLADGLSQLQTGIAQAADGQGQIVGKLPAMTQGFDQLTQGQKDLQSGVAQLNGQLSELSSGLDQSVNGLSQVSGGLQSTQSFLKQLSTAPDREMAGWYVPDEALNSADYKQALDVYMSKDRKMVTFDIVFGGNPYDIGTLGKVDDINAAVARAVKGSGLEKATYAVDGVTSIYNDLNHISARDYSKTVVLMLIGIGIILIVLFRSLIIPIYVILSLILTYYSSMAMTEVIFVRLLGYAGISWAVPFFAFVLLMALGVDYSIFLMDRFNEYRHLPVREAIVKAMGNMGTVILSAAVILGGTFAAMLPSGVMSLLQIATAVLFGLTLYALVILPFFIPVVVGTFGAANWWPFLGRERADSPAAVGEPVHHGSAQITS